VEYGVASPAPADGVSLPPKFVGLNVSVGPFEFVPFVADGLLFRPAAEVEEVIPLGVNGR
jgi:hypothetical protein